MLTNVQDQSTVPSLERIERLDLGYNQISIYDEAFNVLAMLTFLFPKHDNLKLLPDGVFNGLFALE
jgi:hypothetical protein